MSIYNIERGDKLLFFFLDAEEDFAIKKCHVPVFITLINKFSAFFRVPTNHFLPYPEVEWGAQPLHPHLYLGVT
jgi:hypothetical protein